MKNKKVITVLTAISLIFVLFGAIANVYAEDNPYNYSGEPTRAIYYVMPTMKGEDVKWVQCALNLFGNYGLDIDGSFGPACRDATKQFQAAMGLEQDGSFGPATRAAMVNWLNNRNSSSRPSEVTISPSYTTIKHNNKISDNPYNYSGEPSRAIYYVMPTMKGNDVKWVQAALNAFGNYDLAIDGSFGPACREATKRFQASMGMTQDGSFGPATRATMVNWLNNNGGSSSEASSSSSNSNNNSSVSTSYNRSAAIEFARNHAEQDKRDLGSGYGGQYCHNGWECDTFVSHCLKAGGMTDAPNLNPALYDYIKEKGNEYSLDLDGRLFPLSSSHVEVGDVVCWFNSGSSTPAHYTLVGGVDSSNRITVYAHNRVKINEASCLSSGQRATVIHFR